MAVNDYRDSVSPMATHYRADGVTSEGVEFRNDDKFLTDDQIANADDEALLRALSWHLGNQAASLLQTAKLVVQLEKRGRDLSHIKAGFLPILRMIASGRLLPEAVVNFGGLKRVLNCLAWLSPEQQKEIVEGKKIDVVVYDPDQKKTTILKVSPDHMKPEQIDQVFAIDHIRTPEEQVPIVMGERTKAARKKTESVGDFEIDRERQGATVKCKRGTFIMLADLVNVVKAIKE